MFNPIETAPKDGTVIILAHKMFDEFKIDKAWFPDFPLDAKNWYFCENDFIREATKPIGWLPMPDEFQEKITHNLSDLEKDQALDVSD